MLTPKPNCRISSSNVCGGSGQQHQQPLPSRRSASAASPQQPPPSVRGLMQEELERRIGDSQHQHQQHGSVASRQHRQRDGLKKNHSDRRCGDAFLLTHDDKDVEVAAAALPSLNAIEEKEERVFDVISPTHYQNAASILQSRRSNGEKKNHNHHHGENDNHHHDNQWLLDHLHSNITADDLAKTLSFASTPLSKKPSSTMTTMAMNKKPASRPGVRRSRSDDTVSSSTSVLSTLQWYQGGGKRGGASTTSGGSVGKK